MCAAFSGIASATNARVGVNRTAGLLADLAAEHALGALQRRGRVGALLVVAVDGVEDRRVAEVVR